MTGNVERMRITPGGRVGIGITNPAFPLDVEGNIRFGDALKVVATGGTEPLRAVRGQVNQDGSCAVGSGFTCSRLGDGWYQVTFNLAFPSMPTVTLTVLEVGPIEYRYFIQLSEISTTSFAVKIIDVPDNGAFVDHPFTFIAMGPL